MPLITLLTITGNKVMKTFLTELFNYTHHYNQELCNRFLQHEDINEEGPGKIFSHMLNAHHVWNARILQEPALYGIWQIHQVREFSSLEENNFARTIQIIGSTDPGTVINYKNSKGEPFSNTVQDILFHVVNHSTYHRGQIATLFRQNGIAPLLTDYIFYKR